MRTVSIGGVEVSRLCIGGNPFSGFSHQTAARDKEMVDYFAPERIRETLRAAEAAGINTVFARADDHIIAVLRDYRRESGAIQWFAQCCADTRDDDTWKDWLRRAADAGAAALYMHGGLMDYWHAHGRFALFDEALDLMRRLGRPAGFAGHRPVVHEWIHDHLEPDFQMCSYYNPTDRTKDHKHTNVGEKWRLDDRERMLNVIATLRCPAVHYKVFAAGNRPVDEAFAILGRAVRPGDAVCIGVFPKDDPNMLSIDVRLFEQYVEKNAEGDSRR